LTVPMLLLLIVPSSKAKASCLLIFADHMRITPTSFLVLVLILRSRRLRKDFVKKGPGAQILSRHSKPRRSGESGAAMPYIFITECSATEYPSIAWTREYRTCPKVGAWFPRLC